MRALGIASVAAAVLCAACPAGQHDAGSTDGCAAEEKSIGDAITAARACDADVDCGPAFFGCPFGCGLAVRVDRQEALAARARGWASRCTHCEYKCALPVGGARCVGQRCTATAPAASPVATSRDAGRGAVAAALDGGPARPAPSVRDCRPGDAFYVEQALTSFGYFVSAEQVTVSGVFWSTTGKWVEEPTKPLMPGRIELSPGDEFRLSSGKEQQARVTLVAVEGSRARFRYDYSASWPACGDDSRCLDSCEYTVGN